VVQPVRETDAREQRLGPRAAFVLGDPRFEHGQFDVFERRQHGQQVEALEHEADATQP
jgi:hypothetical protein